VRVPPWSLHGGPSRADSPSLSRARGLTGVWVPLSSPSAHEHVPRTTDLRAPLLRSGFNLANRPHPAPRLLPRARGSRGRFVLDLCSSFSATDFIDRVYKHAHRALVPSTLRSTTARNRSAERERVSSTTQLRRCRIEVRDTPSFGPLWVDWELRWMSRRILKPRDAGWRSESGPAAHHWHSAAAGHPMSWLKLLLT
jgi:hypothetical protein